MNEGHVLRLDTSVENGVVNQTLTLRSKLVSQWVFDTKEKHLHDALVMLGWTPPKTEGETK